jgi:hypothetical protein
MLTFKSNIWARHTVVIFLTRLQTVILCADFCVLIADENCQMRWQKKVLLLLIAGCHNIICPANIIRSITGLLSASEAASLLNDRM